MHPDMNPTLQNWAMHGYLLLPLFLGAIAGLCLLISTLRRNLDAGTAASLAGLGGVVVLGMAFMHGRPAAKAQKAEKGPQADVAAIVDHLKAELQKRESMLERVEEEARKRGQMVERLSHELEKLKAAAGGHATPAHAPAAAAPAAPAHAPEAPKPPAEAPRPPADPEKAPEAPEPPAEEPKAGEG